MLYLFVFFMLRSWLCARSTLSSIILHNWRSGSAQLLTTTKSNQREPAIDALLECNVSVLDPVLLMGPRQ